MNESDDRATLKTIKLFVLIARCNRGIFLSDHFKDSKCDCLLFEGSAFMHVYSMKAACIVFKRLRYAAQDLAFT